MGVWLIVMQVFVEHTCLRSRGVFLIVSVHHDKSAEETLKRVRVALLCRGLGHFVRGVVLMGCVVHLTFRLDGARLRCVETSCDAPMETV